MREQTLPKCFSLALPAYNPYAYRPANILLERSTRCSTDVDFAIEERHGDEVPSQVDRMRFQCIDALRTGKRPQDIGSSVAYIRTDRVGPFADVEVQCLLLLQKRRLSALLS